MTWHSRQTIPKPVHQFACENSIIVGESWLSDLNDRSNYFGAPERLYQWPNATAGL